MITQYRVTKQQFIDNEVKIFDAIRNLNTPQLLGVMGVTNAYCWAALKTLGLLTEGKLEAHQAGKIIAASQEGKAAIQMPNTYLTGYLTNQWPGACNSEHSCRQVRAMLSDGLWKSRTDPETGEIVEVYGLGFLKFTPKPSGSTVTPPTLEDMDLPGMAQLYRCAYLLWKEKVQKKNPDTDPFDLLPEHKGALMLTMFDVLFFGMVQFNVCGFERSYLEFAVEAVISNTRKFAAWIYREAHKLKDLAQPAWRAMIRRDLNRVHQVFQAKVTEMGVPY